MPRGTSTKSATPSPVLFELPSMDGIALPAARDTILSSGISTSSTVQKQLSRLAGELYLIAPQSEDRHSGDQHFNFTASSPLPYSEKQHSQFRKEFSRDVDEVQLRVQRVKLQALKHYLRGTHYIQEPPDAKHGWDHHLASRKLWGLAFDLKEKERPLTEIQQRKLISSLNSLIPAELRTSWNPLLSTHDASLVLEVASSFRYHRDQITPRERDRLEPVILAIQRIEHRLADMKHSPLLFSMNTEHAPFEQILKESWNDYRLLVKQYAAIEESDSWFSPCYSESLTPQRGRSQRSEPMRTDYQRFRMPEGDELERNLHASLFRRTEYSEYAASYLFSGGLNALEGIFKLIESDRRAISRQKKDLPVILKTDDIYNEVDYSIERFCAAHGFPLKTFAPTNAEALIEAIRTDLPAAIFLTPLSNAYEMDITPVTGILKSLSEWDWRSTSQDKPDNNRGLAERRMHLVIDNTTASRLARWKNFDFRQLPPFVRVISLESMIKYAEDGLEFAPAGLVTTIGEYTGSDLDHIRRRMGFMPPENTIRKLGHSVDSDALDRKLERHSRNTLFLARTLSPATGKNSFIVEAIHPALSTHTQHSIVDRELSGAGGLFNIGIQTDFLKNYQERHTYGPFNESYLGRKVSEHEYRKSAQAIAKGFTQLSIMLARSAGVELNLGTSFGFNQTRLAVYDRHLPETVEPNYSYREKPYIRVACGTEQIKDVVLIAGVLRRAGEIFSQAIAEQRILTLCESLERQKLELLFGRQ